MTNTRTKLTILILLLTLSFSVIAKGDGEINNELVKDINGELLMTVSANYYFGKIKLTAKERDARKGITHMLSKHDDKYFNQYGIELDTTRYNNLINTISWGKVKNVNIDSVETTIVKSTSKLDLDLIYDAQIDPKESEIQISTNSYKKGYQFFTIYEDGSVTKVETTIIPTFFAGEKDFFENDLFKSNSLSYLEQQVLFMATFLAKKKALSFEIESTKESKDFIKNVHLRMYCIHYGLPYDPNIYLRDISIDNDIKPLTMDQYNKLKKYQTIFKQAFISHFKVNTELVDNKKLLLANHKANAPFLDINSTSFNTLYGVGSDSRHRNSYLTSYLIYSEIQNKPILSFLTNEKMNEAKTKKVEYNYSKFRPVDPLEGDRIAKAAMKYMTWGVEYSSFIESEQENITSDNKVFKDNYLLIKDWVDSANGTLPSELDIKNIDIPDNPAFSDLYEKETLTTPFVNSDGIASPGNPIPFAPIGIDTPKTFNYKMLKQNEARLWFKDNGVLKNPLLFPETVYVDGNNILATTLCEDKDEIPTTIEGYVNEIDLYESTDLLVDKSTLILNLLSHHTLSKEISKLKPFITYQPLMDSFTSKGYVDSTRSMYHPNKIAGVDSIGLLTGSLSMAGITGNFLNVFNQDVVENVVSYNTSENGPNFHVSTFDNILSKNYRFTKADIERSSILLPDLSMARKGDIIVNFTKGDPHVGIIVNVDFSKESEFKSTEDYMKNITIVSTRSGFRMANVGVWHSEGNVYSGFVKDKDEKKYHLRRLLTTKSDSEISVEEQTKNITIKDTYKKDKFEVFDLEYLGLFVDLDINSNYIPNTGELLEINSIEITANLLSDGNGSGEKTPIKDGTDIQILPPLDLFYVPGTAKEKDTNIYQNKGSGLKFYAIDPDYGAMLLATFKLNEDGIVYEDEGPYEVIYNKSILGIGGEAPLLDCKLYIENNKLCYKYPLSPTKHRVTTKFAVRPEDPYGIRPGDDFLLRFGLKSNRSVTGSANQNDFIEIYDKKLIWGANLFMDRREGTNKDWNSINPWNAPPYISDEETNKGVGALGDPHYSKLKFVRHSIVDYSLVPNFDEQIWYGVNEWNYIMKSKEDYILVKDVIDNNLNHMDYLSDLSHGEGMQNIQFPDKDKECFTYSFSSLGWWDPGLNNGKGGYTDINPIYNGINRWSDYNKARTQPSKFEMILSNVAAVPAEHLKTEILKNMTLDQYIRLKETYYKGLRENYFPRDKDGYEIRNILPYILKDDEGKPYTRRVTRTAILNLEGIELFGPESVADMEMSEEESGSGWYIEALDTFHENGYPCVKLLHPDGGEQIYNMLTGEVIEDVEYGGTFNVASGPYTGVSFDEITENIIEQEWGLLGRGGVHWITDIITWQFWGGGPDDKTTEEERNAKVAVAKGTDEYDLPLGYGHYYQNPEAGEVINGGYTQDQINAKLYK